MMTVYDMDSYKHVLLNIQHCMCKLVTYISNAVSDIISEFSSFAENIASVARKGFKLGRHTEDHSGAFIKS